MIKIKEIDHSMTIKKATYINAASKYTVVLLNLLFTSILARVLTPEDYGVVAVITVFSTFFMMIADMGLGAAIIQNQDLDTEDENRIYTATLYMGVIFGILFSVLSVALVKIYNNDVYYSIGALLSIYLCMSIFNIVPQAILLKKKRFTLVAIRTLLTCILGFVVAFILAYLGGKYYAIVVQMIVNIAFVYIWNLKKSKLKIMHKGLMQSIRKVLGFTVFQSVFNFVTYFARNLDNLLVGYFIGDAELGLYNKSYQLMRYPVDILSNLITPTLLPLLSNKKDDKKFIFIQYNKIVKVLIILGIYISIVCFYASEEIILILFGEQWVGAVGAFHWFAAGIILQLVVAVRGTIYQIFGETKKLSKAGTIESMIIVVAIVVGVATGDIEKLSKYYLVGFIFYFLHCQIYLAKDCFEIPVTEVFKEYRKPCLIYVILFAVMYFVPTLETIFLSAILKGCVAGVSYLLLLLFTKELQYLLPVLPNKIKRYYHSKFYE